MYKAHADIAYAFREAIGAALNIPNDIEIPSILEPKKRGKAKAAPASATVSATAEDLHSVKAWFTKRNIVIGNYYKGTADDTETAYLLKRIDPSGKFLILEGACKPKKVDKDTFIKTYEPTVALKREGGAWAFVMAEDSRASVS